MKCEYRHFHQDRNYSGRRLDVSYWNIRYWSTERCYIIPNQWKFFFFPGSQRSKNPSSLSIYTPGWRVAAVGILAFSLRGSSSSWVPASSSLFTSSLCSSTSQPEQESALPFSSMVYLCITLKFLTLSS